MKRSLIGGVFLLLLPICGLLVSLTMGRIHDPIAQDLTRAASCALDSRWDQALALSAEAANTWQRHEVFRACFADHSPMEEVDACFAQLEVYGIMREETAFAAACRETARKVTAMAEAHKLIFHNFF